MSAEVALERMRAKLSSAKPSKKGWQPPEREDFADGQVLAFDQSLSNTGMVLVTAQAGRIEVSQAQVLQPPKSDVRGHAGTLEKAVALEELLSTAFLAHPDVEAVLFEAPPVQGFRIESSLIGAYLVLQQARSYALPYSMISRQHALALLVPRENRGGKSAVKAYIERYYDSWTGARNEHTSDACLLALTYLLEKP